MASTRRPTALVTGASSGIGRAFAEVLASEGHDLVVVARDTARLETLVKEVREHHDARAEILAADLVDRDQLATVEARLADRDRPVELLVNNAGFGTYGSFWTLPVEVEEREVCLNVLALMRLTHAALGPMVERRHGGVINVSSIAGHQPTPTDATYGATKAFVTSFSQALHEELRGTGVRCMVVCPGFTRTEFQERAGYDAGNVPRFMWQQPHQVVAAALKAYQRGRAVCVPGALNRATAGLSQVVPDAVTRRAAHLVTRRTT